MNQKNFKYIEILFCITYSIILCFATYMMKNSDIRFSIYVFEMLIAERSYQYIIIPYIIIIAIFIINKSLFRDNLKTNIISTAIVLIITIISYYKYQILKLPFLPNDILLIGNTDQIAKFGLTFPPINIIILTIMLILLLVLQYLIRKKYIEKSKITLKNDIYRIPLLVIGIIIIYNICIVQNRFIKLHVKNELGDNYAWMGANAVFFMHLGDLYTVAPEGYTEESIKEIKEEYERIEDNSTNDKPNVIIIMNESFSNPNKIKSVEYTINPIQGITQLEQNDKKCITGNIITPVFGGGTSLPEFEVLTGLSSYFLEKQIFPYTSYIKSDINSIVRAYKNNGYTTIGIHPNTKTFYNRVNVFKYLGFNKAIFEEDMENSEIKGGLVSDNEFANQIIKAFEIDNESKFIFGVTMQNHMPYFEKNYEKYDVDIKADKLTETERLELKKYIQGVYDGDKMYIKLVEYLKSSQQPTILVMFGDHLPPLNSNIYDNFSNLERFTTPYIIWTNFDVNYENILSEYMSPGALALALTKISNVTVPWYLKTFKELYEKYPAINNQFIITKDYELKETNDIKNEKIIKNCDIIQYDLLIKKKYIPVK